MQNPFDEEVDRRGTNSLKWEFIQREGDPQHWDHTDRRFEEGGLLPMWVADMDFRCPEPVVHALIERAQKGIYGYTAPTAAFHQSVVKWMARRHGWQIEREWICVTPGVVPALNMLVRTFVPPGGRVLVQPPVYYPFFSAIVQNGGEVVANPLINEGRRYRMDFADLEAKAKGPRVKMVILCSPHNPVGRVWTQDELVRFGEICVDNHVLVVSDEIHGDLVYKPNVFTPFAKISREFAQGSIICTAPSKTFNLAGLQTSCIIIPSGDLRAQFADVVKSNGLDLTNTFGVVGLQAAYEHGEQWLEQLLTYLDGNLHYLQSYLAEHIPRIDFVRPEGTYLVWLDCRRLPLDDAALKGLMMDEAGVYLDDGIIFGREGQGFQRINIACPRSRLAEALDRISRAVAGLPNRSN
jgi:cystathionine beta-lyase